MQKGKESMWKGKEPVGKGTEPVGIQVEGFEEELMRPFVGPKQALSRSQKVIGESCFFDLDSY